MAYMRDASGKRLDSITVLPSANGRVPSYRRSQPSVLPGPPISALNIAPFAEFNSGSATGYTFGASYKVTADATDLQLVYLGWQTTNSLTPKESGLSNAAPLKASIEVGGVIYPVSFGPALVGTLDRMGALVSTPIGIVVHKGDVIRVRSYSNVASGSKTPKMMEMGGGPGYTPTGDGFYAGDVAGGGAFSSQAAGGFTNPILCGQPLTPVPTAFGLGDSILSGQADINGGASHNRNWGYFTRGLAGAQVGGVRVAAVSLQAADFASNYRWPTIASACSHAYVALGRNDLNGGRTLTQIQADLTTIIGQLASRGLAVYLGTVPPYALSSDNWVTVAGQTLVSTEATRVALNDWIRGLPAGASGVVDVADRLEVNAANALTRNGGYWRVPTSTPAITAASVTSNSATVTTAAAHGFAVGQTVVVAGSTATFNGSVMVTAVPSPTTFSYAVTAADTTVGAGGTAAGTFTPDGIHPSTPAHIAMSLAMQTWAAALTVA